MRLIAFKNGTNYSKAEQLDRKNPSMESIMCQLTGSTRIRIKRPRSQLTGETRIRLSQIKDLKTWVYDRKYKVGEISEKTGLQKQPDGSWKEPANKKQGRSLKSESKTGNKADAKPLTNEQKAQTKAVEDRINKSGWFKNPSTLDGMHPDAAANIEKQCARIFDEFPQMKGFVEGLKVEEFKGFEKNSFAKCDGTKSSAFIVFNSSFYSDNAELEQTYEMQVKQNYHPAGTKADSLAVHEMAHCICDFIAQKRGQDMFDFCREVVQYTNQTFEENGITIDITKELGRYSIDLEACKDLNTQCAELIAEAYAEFKCSEKPRRLAYFIGNLIEGEI